MDTWPNDDVTIERLLRTPGTWAVVGLSNNVERAAYPVSALLQRLGHTIIPIHPSAPTVHGQQGYRSLAEVPLPVDVVDLFVRSELAGDVVDQAIAVGAKAVWLQLGVIDLEAGQRAADAGLDVVMDDCPAIACRRLGI